MTMDTSAGRILAVAATAWLVPQVAHANTDGPDLAYVEEGERTVVGGDTAPAGKWPDTAGILFGGNQPECTGTLVAPTVVLTAAHCIDGSLSAVKLNAIQASETGEVVDVVKRVAHPDRSFDIGLVVLAQPAQTQPRLIASGCVRDLYMKDGADVAIVGWGATDFNASQFPSTLQQALAKITDHDCSESGKGCDTGARPDGEVIAGGDGIDSCNGDSGGPLYLLTERGDFLAGVTSRATSDATRFCGDGGIYVRPDKVIDWIEQEGGVDIPEPTCNSAPEPAALAMEVLAGATESVTIEPNDPDTADAHTYTIATAPMFGTAEVDASGTVSYTANADYEGPDQIVVTVTDNGVPALSNTVVVTVTVLPDDSEGGCGCAATGTSGGAGGAVLFGLVALAFVRRRRAL